MHVGVESESVHFAHVRRHLLTWHGPFKGLTLLLLNKTCPLLANSVDPDLDLHCLSLNM